MVAIVCRLIGHDWGLGEVTHRGTLTHFRLCTRCGRYEVQNVIGRWKPVERSH